MTHARNHCCLLHGTWWIKGKPSQTATPPEEQSKNLVWSEASLWKNSIMQLQGMKGPDLMPRQIPSCLGLLRQALLHMYFRSSDVYLLILTPGIGCLAWATPIVWGGWALCSSCSCVRTNRTAACRQTHGGEGFGEYLHLHSSPPCPILLSLPSTHLQG